MLDQALDYNERGWNVLPIQRGRKIPARPWKEWQTKRQTIEDVMRLFEHHRGRIAIVTGSISGVVIRDCDTLEEGRVWWKEHPTPLLVRTPRGVHCYYQHPGKPVPNQQGEDVRGDGGFVVAPPSDGYEWIKNLFDIDFDDVPVWPLSKRPVDTVSSTCRQVRNGVAYILKIHATAGQGGHGQTIKAAVRLAESGMTEVEILSALIEWNRTNCHPEFTVKELTHKAIEGYRLVLQKANQQLALADGCRDGSCDSGGRMQ